MEGNGMSAAEWCFNMRDKSFADGDVASGNAYQDLGSMWQKREVGEGGTRGVDKSCSD